MCKSFFMKSMTGFGAASAPVLGQMLRLELSGINRKQLEVALNIPRSWNELEACIRRTLGEHISRGRVQVSITSEKATEARTTLRLNEEKLASLRALLPELQEQLGRELDLSLGELMRANIIEEVVDHALEDDAEARWQQLEPLLRQALDALLAMKAQEGANLKRDLLTRIATLRVLRQQISEGAEGSARRHRELLLARLEEAGLPLALDDERIVKEVALYAERCDISEELTRLDSHLEQFCQICEKDEPVGRPLDFLCQEIFRELNTTGSKVNNAALAQLIVTAKTELEKIREQVQNVE